MADNFQAFFDDSRTANGEFVLAGHIATAEQWSKFTGEWELLLPKATKAKNGNYHFKMSEMTSSHMMPRVEEFYRVIEKHVALSVSCRMNQADFVRGQERAEFVLSQLGIYPEFGRWNNLYYFLFRALIDNFHQVRHEKISKIIPIDEPIELIFDTQRERSFIKKAWEGWVASRDEEVRPRYGEAPRFEDDQEYLALQGADLWAWWVREWYEEDASDIPDKMREFDFGSWRGEKRPLTYFSINEEQIKDMFQKMAFAELPHCRSWTGP
jgi:hypothetical protein